MNSRNPLDSTCQRYLDNKRKTRLVQLFPFFKILYLLSLYRINVSLHTLNLLLINFISTLTKLLHNDLKQGLNIELILAITYRAYFYFYEAAMLRT